MKLAILFLFGLIGCGTTTSYFEYHNVEKASHINYVKKIPIWIDSGFSDKEMDEIMLGVGEWNKSLNGQMVLEVEKERFLGLAGGAGLVKKAVISNLGWVMIKVGEEEAEEMEVSPQVLAFVTGKDKHFLIVLGERIGTRSLKEIAMHEMGHLLGADHLEVNGLMYPTNSVHQVNCIDKVSMLQVAGMWDLDSSKMTYCSTPEFP